jgi:hypothetical protein
MTRSAADTQTRRAPARGGTPAATRGSGREAPAREFSVDAVVPARIAEDGGEQ